MPRIFDNIDLNLLPALRETLKVSSRSDFCVGYFNLRGWKAIDDLVEQWVGGPGKQCRLLVGMQRRPQDELRTALSLSQDRDALDNQSALRLKKRLAKEFRDQLIRGVPTNADEAGLRRLAAQLKAGKVVVKLFLRDSLHAKLYLLFRTDPINPIIGYLGSSNLTLAGLSHQRELNVDVLDHDAANKLVGWFENRWNDRWCIDITAELVQVIQESWAREELLPPYHVYVKMAYHLAQEARAGLLEFRIPAEFGQPVVRVSSGCSQDRSKPPEQARRRANRGCGRFGEDVDGYSARQDLPGRPFHGNTHHLSEELGEDVGGLCCRVSPDCQGSLGNESTVGTSRSAEVSGGCHRRKSEPAQSRRDAVPRHSGVHPRKRE